MFGRNRRNLRCIVSGRVSLLSWVFFFCIAGSIIGVYGYLGAIYSCPGVKVTQCHECHMGRSSFQSVIILTLQLSWASGSLFRASIMPDLESTPTNCLCMTRHVSRSSKVIRSHVRSLTLDDLEWRNFILRSISGCLEAYKPNYLVPIYSSRSTL